MYKWIRHCLWQWWLVVCQRLSPKNEVSSTISRSLIGPLYLKLRVTNSMFGELNLYIANQPALAVNCHIDALLFPLRVFNIFLVNIVPWKDILPCRPSVCVFTVTYPITLHIYNENVCTFYMYYDMTYCSWDSHLLGSKTLSLYGLQQWTLPIPTKGER